VIRVLEFSIYHSSNAYLGHFLAERALEDFPVEVVRQPLCVPKERGIWVADLVGGKASARQDAYNREDCLRWAKRHRIEMRFPEAAEIARRVARWRALPCAREELAARTYYGALGSGREAALDAALFRAGYVDLADVNDEEVVRRACETAGLDPDSAIRVGAGAGPPARRGARGIRPAGVSRHAHLRGRRGAILGQRPRGLDGRRGAPRGRAPERVATSARRGASLLSRRPYAESRRGSSIFGSSRFAR